VPLSIPAVVFFPLLFLVIRDCQPQLQGRQSAKLCRLAFGEFPPILQAKFEVSLRETLEKIAPRSLDE
jgi:hypothetical protein